MAIPAFYLPKLVSNAQAAPFQADASTSNFRMNFHRFKIAGDSTTTYTAVRIAVMNTVSTQTNESSVMKTVTPTATIYYNGTEYPVTFTGTIASNNYLYSSPVAGLTFNKALDDEFWIGFEAEGSDAVSGNYCRNTVSWSFLGEVSISAASRTVDVRTGMPYGARATATVSGGNITAGTVARGGWNYTAAPSVYAFEIGPDGVHYTKAVGNATISGGAITAITITSGTPPAGLAAWSSPILSVAFGRTGISASNSIPGWKPSVILGTPNKNLINDVLVGDSITRGNGEALPPDENGNQGIYEIGIANRCGTFNAAIGSGTASVFANWATNYPKLFELIQTIKPNKCVLAIGTNDIRNGTTLTTLRTNINNIKTKLRSMGMKVKMATVLPRTTSGTLVTPLDSNFTVGGLAETINAEIVAGSAINNDLGVITGNLHFSNPSNVWEWGGTFVTDGTHPRANGLTKARETAWKTQFDNFTNIPALAELSVPAGAKIWAMGDSIVARNHDPQSNWSTTGERSNGTKGALVVARTLDSRFDFFAYYDASQTNYILRNGTNKGISGETTTQMLARIADVTSLMGPNDVFYLAGGTNDIRNVGEPSDVTIYNNLVTMIAAVRAVNPNCGVIFNTIRATSNSTEALAYGINSTQLARMQSVNTMIRAYCAANSMWCKLSDVYAAYDQGDGYADSSLLEDGLHPNPTGTGKEVVNHLLPAIQSLIKAGSTRETGANLYAFSFNTTGGIVGSGASGVVPTGLRVLRTVTTGGTTVVSSVVNEDGVDKVQLDFTVGGTGIEQFRLGAHNVFDTITCSNNAWLKFMVDVETDNNFLHPGINVEFYKTSTTANPFSFGSKYQPAVGNAPLSQRGKKFTISTEALPATGTSFNSLVRMVTAIDGNRGGTTRVKFSNPRIVEVPDPSTK